MCDKDCAALWQGLGCLALQRRRGSSVRVENNRSENKPASCKVIWLLESEVLLPVQMYLLLGVLDGRCNMAALVF